MNDMALDTPGFPVTGSHESHERHVGRRSGESSAAAAKVDPIPLSAMGIELEYMIVDRKTLDVRPYTEILFRDDVGDPIDDIAASDFGWSKEVVRHVIEINNSKPVASLDGLAAGFQREIERMDARLAHLDARLMPSAMHPWMDPLIDTRLWDEPRNRINRAYASIFDLGTHGWANLQSMHIDLAYGNDEDFATVHSAIRAVLPIIPAIAASSPFANGQRAHFDDYRLEAYRTNASGFPTITGHIIPEVVSSRQAYEEHILSPMYRAIALHDPERLLRFEWLNSRGAIARFDRAAIEIRVADVQEAPKMDVAIASAVIGTVKALHGQSLSTRAMQDSLAARQLARILSDCARDGSRAQIDDPAYLKLFRYPADDCSVMDLWKHIASFEPVATELDQSRSALGWNVLMDSGSLSSRLLRAAGENPDRARLAELYRELCACLVEGRSFESGRAQ